MKKIKFLILTACFAVATPVLAQLQLSSQSGNQTIASIELDARFVPPQVQVYINETISNPHSCTNSHRYAFSLDAAGEGILAILLAAQAAGRSIQVNTEECQDGVPKMKIVRVNSSQ
ncbi:MAG: hypothetical protein NPIRA05_15370 [Nitrospirales bacterium]|nr:MAG: hypothetical protein NPIRA05_15370 [Nitrospirales bacterium]